MTICKICRVEFIRQSISQPTCLDPVCKSEWKRQKAIRKGLRERKEAIKSRSKWLKEAQAAFNAYIRYRDKGQPCISCQRLHTGQIHAGHYLSVGAQPALRFNEDNCHGQCAPCNTYLSGNLARYRSGLIVKIGIDRVEALEIQQPPIKWSIEDSKAIKAKYKANLKEVIE